MVHFQNLYVKVHINHLKNLELNLKDTVFVLLKN